MVSVVIDGYFHDDTGRLILLVANDSFGMLCSIRMDDSM